MFKTLRSLHFLNPIKNFRSRLWLTLALTVLIFCIWTPKRVRAQVNTWAEKAPVPSRENQVAATAINGKLYLLGYFFFDPDNGGLITKLRVYDPGTNTWGEKAPMQKGRVTLAVAEIGGKLYAVGGQSATGFSSKLEVYDPATNTWEEKAPMPTARYGLAAVPIDGKLYAVGGIRPFPNFITSKLEVYDPATNTWEEKAPMPTARGILGAAAIDGKLYVVGGFADPQLNGAKLEVYDPSTDTWEEKAPLSEPRRGVAAAEIGGKLYVVGGAVPFVGAISKLETYNPATNTWEELPPMPTKRHDLAAVAISGKLYAVGGISDERDSKLEVFTTESALNTPVGMGVLVTPIDSTTGRPAPITLSFSNVTSDGVTTLTSSSSNPGASLPNRFRVGSPPTYYDINTTAQYTPPVTICVQYPETAYQHNESNLKLMHFNGAAWEDVTTSLDLQNNIICGQTNSLSPFVIAEEDQPPEITVPGPISATATSNSGASVSYANATASDDFDTAVTVNCTPQSGSTFPLGVTSVQCPASDSAGNSAEECFNVTVAYDWSGVFQPVNANGSSVFRLGSTIPVKFALTGASAGVNNAIAKLYYAKISDNLVGSDVEATSTASATTGNVFRHDPAAGQYVFNWGTKGLTVGTYQLRIDLGDGAMHTVNVSLK